MALLPRLALLLGLAISASASASASAAALEAGVQQRIRAATFEVVQKKPDDGAVSYDRPLPLELIPYQQRIDKYRSIGTAFSIGGNRYVTASHVFQLGSGSQFGPPALRDAAGNVYDIDKVWKFSDREDFVEFSLSQEPRVSASSRLAAPALDDTVFAVGNALGEGVVIRDGVFTSETPEEEDGEWKWVRFSAAASPGNSGGPLIDQAGRVIGVVLRKSESENLNYALPIERLAGMREGEGASPVACPCVLRYSMPARRSRCARTSPAAGADRVLQQRPQGDHGEDRAGPARTARTQSRSRVSQRHEIIAAAAHRTVRAVPPRGA